MEKTGKRARHSGWGLALALSVILGAICLQACPAPEAPTGPADEQALVARVNGTPITEGELQAALWREAGARVLVDMIDEALITQAAVRKGLQPSPEQVDLRLQSALAMTGGEAGYDQLLQGEGMSREQYRRRAELSVLVDALVIEQTRVGEDEVRQYYDKHRESYQHGPLARARMILCATKENAATVKQALEAGGDFAGLAEAFSEDPGTKAKGGDMGWFQAGDYAKELTDVAFTLAAGGVSDVIPGPDGYYLLKLEERKPAGEKALKEVRGEIVTTLKYQRLPEERKKWMVEQRRKVRVGLDDRALREAVRQRLETAAPPTVGAF